MHDIKHVTPDFAVSPQISASQLALLKSAGFTTVICNRPDHEDAGQPTFAEIKAAAEAAGLEAPTSRSCRDGRPGGVMSSPSTPP